MLYESHGLIDADILLTYNYKTSRVAHQRLDYMLKRGCEKMININIDYGLSILPDTILRIANDEEFQWLLQPELKAIKDGLIYVEEKLSSHEKYRGYRNAQGQRQGVGIYTLGLYVTEIGQLHEDKLHGYARKKYYFDSINSW